MLAARLSLNHATDDTHRRSRVRGSWTADAVPGPDRLHHARAVGVVAALEAMPRTVDPGRCVALGVARDEVLVRERGAGAETLPGPARRVDHYPSVLAVAGLVVLSGAHLKAGQECRRC